MNPDSLATMDAYDVRCLAEIIVGEDRVPTDVLRELIEQYGMDEPDDDA
jgi:hypothetical protein